MSIKVVFFDVGETLVDETRLWKGWAAYFCVSTKEFLRVLREAIERGDDHRCALDHFRPGLDLAAARQERESFATRTYSTSMTSILMRSHPSCRCAARGIAWALPETNQCRPNRYLLGSAFK